MGAARESAMTPSDLGDASIRNRRYWPWSEIVGVMLVILFLAVLILPFALDQRFGRSAKVFLLVVAFAMAGYCLRFWLLVLDLKERPLPGRRETTRIVWAWVRRGIRPESPYRVRATVA